MWQGKQAKPLNFVTAFFVYSYNREKSRSFLDEFLFYRSGIIGRLCFGADTPMVFNLLVTLAL